MQVIVALENVIKTYTFPDDSDIHFKSAAAGYIQITPRQGHHSWFNPDFVIAIVPGTKAGG